MISARLRVVAAAAALCALAACGTSGSGGSGDANKVTFWHYYAQGIPATAKFTKDLNDTYAKAKLAKPLNSVYVPGEQLTQKVIATAATKQGPDVFVQGGADLLQLIKAGAIADITAQFDKFPDKAQIPDANVIKKDGKVYGVQGFNNTTALWYNKTILDELGITPPTTMDELSAALEKIGKKYIGIGLPGQGDQDVNAFSFITAYGFDYAKPDAAALETSLKLVGGWAEKGYVPRDAATWTPDVAFQKFTAGGMAFVLGGNWQYGNAKKAASFKYGVVPVPNGSAPAKVYQFGDNVHVSAFTKDKDAAFNAVAAMFLSKEGELAALEAGSMPVRKDLADTEGMKDPIYTQFNKALENGVPYLLPGFGTELTQMRKPVAEAWSAVLAGQSSPSEAATTAVAAIQRVAK
ncbi:sugar ABC transporter substrate-binding protein [Nonomuraea sp. CA-143628]|uniref:sugar ABC transporter substrate-binding protein n=1 Tax=Nonomuraea sp. CA-143628 TaxID=3239997 RepID=UPI003D93383C